MKKQVTNFCRCEFCHRDTGEFHTRNCVQFQMRLKRLHDSLAKLPQREQGGLTAAAILDLQIETVASNAAAGLRIAAGGGSKWEPNS